MRGREDGPDGEERGEARHGCLGRHEMAILLWVERNLGAWLKSTGRKIKNDKTGEGDMGIETSPCVPLLGKEGDRNGLRSAHR